MNVAQEEKKTDVVKLTIDGREIEAPKGRMVLQAALDAGIDIPHFCYHKNLSVAGNCRMCVVEVENMPRPVISCNLPAAEGMKVFTQTPKVLEARRATMEFLLVNHPIDCPICDQAGECSLQDYYMEHARHGSRVLLDEKVRKPKRQSLGDHIVLDSERCVLCSRCVRFCDEITGTSELGIYDRGHTATVGTYMGRPLSEDNHYQGCLADICPVGALTDKDFRFQMRVWFMKRTASVCPGCSAGCNIHIDARDDRVHRLKPRENDCVNKTWICDEGRYGYKSINAENRLLEPLEKNAEGKFQPKSWDVALSRIAHKLGSFASNGGAAVVGSAQLTLEDLFALKQLAAAAGDGQVHYRYTDAWKDPSARLDGLLRRKDKNPNTRGCLALGLQAGEETIDGLASDIEAGKIKAALIFDSLELRTADSGKRLLAALSRLEFCAIFTTHDDPELRVAGILLPATTYAEKSGTFVNCDGRIQRIRKAIPALGRAFDPWVAASMLLHNLQRSAPWEKAEDVFAALAESVPAFKGLTLDAIGEQGVLCNEDA